MSYKEELEQDRIQNYLDKTSKENQKKEQIS